jgi:hypothetical protein
MSFRSVNGIGMDKGGWTRRRSLLMQKFFGRRGYAELCVSLTRMMLMAFGPTSSVVDRRWPPVRPASGMVGSDDDRGRLGRYSCVDRVAMNG